MCNLSWSIQRQKKHPTLSLCFLRFILSCAGNRYHIYTWTALQQWYHHHHRHHLSCWAWILCFWAVFFLCSYLSLSFSIFAIGFLWVCHVARSFFYLICMKLDWMLTNANTNIYPNNLLNIRFFRVLFIFPFVLY